jgi:hypothetical protein
MDAGASATVRCCSGLSDNMRAAMHDTGVEGAPTVWFTNLV